MPSSKKQKRKATNRREVLVIRNQIGPLQLPKRKEEFLRKMLQYRFKNLYTKLRTDHPEVFEDRRQDYNGEARNYWHYGYLAALKDFLHLIQRGVWPLDAYNPNHPLDLPEDD